MEKKPAWKNAVIILFAGGGLLFFAVAADANVGKELWNTTYIPTTGNYGGDFRSIGFLPDGSVLTSGWRSEADSSSAVGVRLDEATGSILDTPAEWILYPTTGWGDYTHDRFYGQAIDDTDIYLGGLGKNTIVSRGYTPTLLKYRKNTEDGTSIALWEKRYAPNTEYGGYYGVAVNSAGSIYAAGFYGPNATASGFDWFIHKYDDLGNEFSGFPVIFDYDGQEDRIEDIAVDSDGNFIVVGYVTVVATTNHTNWFVRKYSADGSSVLWEVNYDHNSSGLNDRAQGLALDSGDNVIVSGYVNNGSAGADDYDWCIAKYAKNGGALLWQQTWDMNNTWGIAFDMITDADNNIYVLGTQTNQSGLRRSFIQYRDGGTGTLLKSQEISQTVFKLSNGTVLDPNLQSDYLRRLVLQGRYIVATGYSTHPSYPRYAARVVKFAISDTYHVSPAFDTNCSDGECNLQAALTAAETNNGFNGDLHLQQGSYAGTFTYQPLSGNNGDLTILGGYSANFLTRFIDPANTILDGGNSGTVLLLNPGVASQTTTVDGSIIISGITVKNGNAGSPAMGGGILALTNAPGKIELTDNIIENNHADETGGGCAVAVWDFSTQNGGDITFTNNIVRDNTVSLAGATNGNGGGCSFIISGTTVLANNLVYGNSVGNSTTYTTPDGGGLDFSLLAGELTLTNNTIVDNEVFSQSPPAATASGGGISLGTDTSAAWNKTVVALYNNIIFDNTVTTGLGADIHNRVISASATTDSSLLISNSDHHGYLKSTDTGTVDPVLTANIDASPQFSSVSLSRYHLTNGSPCIDVGDNTAPDMPSQDLGGTIRPQDGNDDGTATANMGCFETVVNSEMPWTLFIPAITGMHP